MKKQNYRAKVGPPDMFDIIGAQQFCMAVSQGLREHHRLLDVGCGGLRGGRFFITYLDVGNYVGIEPDVDLLQYGKEAEVGLDTIKRKSPYFFTFDTFMLSRAPKQSYHDFVLAQSILTHAGEDLIPTIFGEAYLALAPGGRFIGTFFEGSQENKAGWLGNQVAVYDRLKLKNIADIVGFIDFSTLISNHPMGQTWFAARKGK